jgi:hypothetical protein
LKNAGWRRTYTGRQHRTWQETLAHVHSVGVIVTTNKAIKEGFNLDIDNFIVQK